MIVPQTQSWLWMMMNKGIILSALAVNQLRHSVNLRSNFLSLSGVTWLSTRRTSISFTPPRQLPLLSRSLLAVSSQWLPRFGGSKPFNSTSYSHPLRHGRPDRGTSYNEESP